jgi:hypothetical protein
MDQSDTIIHKYNDKELIEFKNKNIYMIDNLFDISLCTQIIDEMENKLTYKHLSYFNGNNVLCYNTINPENISIKNKILELTSDLLHFIKITFPEMNLDSFSFFQLRKVYGATREHVDGVFGETIEHPLHSNALVKTIRTLTLVVALNDDFDGGIHSFPTQDFNVKLKTGTCLLFPPYWTHKHSVSDINNKYRYIFSLWGLTNNIVINENNSQLHNIIIIQ